MCVNHVLWYMHLSTKQKSKREELVKKSKENKVKCVRKKRKTCKFKIDELLNGASFIVMFIPGHIPRQQTGKDLNTCTR